MTELVSLEKWWAMISTETLILSITFAVGIVAILLWPEEPRKLEPRLQAMLENRSTRNEKHKALVKLRGAISFLISIAGMHLVLEKLSNWRREYFRKSSQKEALLRQAGLRGQQAYLYFETVRFILCLALGLLAFGFMTRTGSGSNNPIQITVIILLALSLGAYLPNIYIRHRIARRHAEFDASWDDAVGLLIICLEAGLSIEVALRRIARELAVSAPVLAEELIITLTELSLLNERRQAYQNLAKRIELPNVQSVMITLVQAEKQGASISNSLRVISRSNRESRLSRAETKAAALGPKMTIPMLLFFLPIIFVVILAPIVLTADFNF